MNVFGAHEAKVYYVQEATFGVTPTNPSMLGIATAEDVEPNLNSRLIKLRGVGSRDLNLIRRGSRDVSLKAVYSVPSAAPIDFLQYVQTLNSMSLELFYEKSSGVVDLLHKGCRMDKLTVECSVESVIKATAELVGQELVVGTAKIPGASYSDYSGAVPFYDSYVKKGVTTLERVTDFKFSVENNLKRVPVIRSTSGYLLKYLQERHRNCGGELTFEFESKEEFDDVINDSEFTLEFGLGGANKTVFTGCKWESISTPTKTEDLISLKAPFVAKSAAIS